MTTLRRELIQKIKNILIKDAVFCSDGLELETPFEGKYQELAEKLADGVLELRAFSEEKKRDILKKSDPAWSILAGEEISQEAVDAAKAEEDAKTAFERDMKFNPLPWGSTKAWEKLEKFVIREYEKDHSIFARYKSWQMNDGRYVAMKNNRIRSHPDEFVSNFPDFLAHTAMYGKKESSVDTDSKDAPMSY